MGMRFRKSKKIAPGVKVNIGKKGASVTLGAKGVHHTISTTGRKTTSIGVPGTGISYVKTSGNTSKQSNNTDKSEDASSNLRLVKCPSCDRSFPEGVRKCPVCGSQINDSPDVNNFSNDDLYKRKWYQQTGWIIGLLFLFFPVGLYLMWKYADWKKVPKIIISAILGIGILSAIFSPKIEKITLSADTASTYDINETVAIKVITEPENKSISDSAIKISGGSASISKDKILFIADTPGKYNIHVEESNVISNTITLNCEDKTAIAKQKKEKAQKKEAEEAARKEAEEAAAAKKQAEEEAARKKAEEEAIAQKQAEEAAAQAEQVRLAAEAAAQEQAQQEAELQAAIDNSDPIVYITDTGSKYHSAGCRTLADSQYERHLSEVIGSYDPCGICHPPTQ